MIQLKIVDILLIASLTVYVDINFYVYVDCKTYFIYDYYYKYLVKLF